MVAGAYAADMPNGLRVKELKSRAPRITAKLQQHFVDKNIGGRRLSHLRPASYLLREQQSLLPKMSKETIERAAALFERVNACIE